MTFAMAFPWYLYREAYAYGNLQRCLGRYTSQVPLILRYVVPVALDIRLALFQAIHDNSTLKAFNDEKLYLRHGASWKKVDNVSCVRSPGARPHAHLSYGATCCIRCHHPGVDPP